MESLVKLTVKTPNQGIDDIQVNCELDWTVRKLKEYLQDVYPSKPSSNSQKLIYLGKLLQDHLSLKEVFGEWGARTVHIVCSEAHESSTTSSMATATTSTSSVASDSTGLRYRGQPSLSGLPNPLQTPMMSSMFSQPITSSSTMSQSYQQYYQMQAQYALQYQQQMQLYQQQWYQWQQGISSGQLPNHYSTGYFPTTPLTPTSSTPPSPTEPHIRLQQPLQEEQPPQQPAQPDAVPNQPNQANQNVRMNAGPGGVGINDEDDQANPQNRDWLDWLYTSLRAFMLLSIVYFYSSTSRFIMVTILAFLLYLYQNGWFTPRRIPVIPEPPVADGQNGEQEDIVEPQNNPDLQDNVDSITNLPQEPAQNIPPQPSALRILCTFFVSFVTSLIPTPPAIPQQ